MGALNEQLLHTKVICRWCLTTECRLKHRKALALQKENKLLDEKYVFKSRKDLYRRRASCQLRVRYSLDGPIKGEGSCNMRTSICLEKPVYRRWHHIMKIHEESGRTVLQKHYMLQTKWMVLYMSL